MWRRARSLRLPDGDVAGQARRATTKSSVSRRFVALSTAKLKEWLAADLSGLDLLVIQLDGLHVGNHMLVAAIGIDGAGDKHVLAVCVRPMSAQAPGHMFAGLLTVWPDRNLHQRIMSQPVGVDGILVAARNRRDPRHHHFVHLVLDAARVASIRHCSGKPCEPPSLRSASRNSSRPPSDD